MTKQEEKLLNKLKDYFKGKYGDSWEDEFKAYAEKLISDGHISVGTVLEFLKDVTPNEMLADFLAEKISPPPIKKKKVKPSSSYSSMGDGCGRSSRSSC